LTGSFSDFFGAVPEGALPNLTNWWSGDGDFLDWYGYHGVSSPPGAVSFTTGVSTEAFDLDRGEVVSEAVVIPSIPDRVNDAQQLTLATWVHLDPEGPADDIQRFVTLSKEKAVLRQEGWPGVSNRMLHFYMHFAPFNEEEFNLEAIRVDNAFQTGCYQFFVGTYDGDWMRAYVDGEQVGERNVPGGVVMDTYGWAELGSEGTEGLQGSLDEVMIFDRALTPDEIQEIYDYVPAGDKCGPTYTVQGTVFYSTNELGGVTVDLGQGPVTEPTWLRTTVTDETGVYEFDFVPPGDYWVKVYGADYGAPGEYIGWKSSSLTVVMGGEPGGPGRWRLRGSGERDRHLGAGGAGRKCDELLHDRHRTFPRRDLHLAGRRVRRRRSSCGDHQPGLPIHRRPSHPGHRWYHRPGRVGRRRLVWTHHR
jgi:hypothetical protein